MPYQSLEPRCAGTRPLPGLIPTSPHDAAGMRIDPIPSAPWATGTMPAATAAADPPEDPPDVLAVSQGLRVMPNGESVAPKTHSSAARVIPTTTAPAARSRATTGWSAGCGPSGVSGEPLRMGSPATATLSLAATGTPASGSRPRSVRSATSAASAAAFSLRTSWKAPSRSSRSAIRVKAVATASVADSRPLRTPDAISVADIGSVEGTWQRVRPPPQAEPSAESAPIPGAGRGRGDRRRGG
jgi:hypothetical protein